MRTITSATSIALAKCEEDCQIAEKLAIVDKCEQYDTSSSVERALIVTKDDYRTTLLLSRY